jgi:hypothetical protein
MSPAALVVRYARSVLLMVSAAALLSTSGDASAKKPKKPSASNTPVLGWHREAGWTGDCWYPPDFAAMTEGQKRLAWQETRDAIMAQWRGERSDGISMNAQHIDRLETAMLSKADRVELVAKENLEQCKAFRASGAADAWATWLTSMSGRLTEGECPYPPLDYTAYNYLSVNTDWQNPLNVCKGDKIEVHGTEADYYQLSAKGAFINVDGDPSAPVTPSLPCNIEGCKRGQLIMRFTSVTGVSQVVPVGITLEFLAPEHGRIEVMINDDSFEDNKFKTERGVEHHTGIEVKPAKGG